MSADPTHESFPPGTVIDGRYEIRKMVGRGSFGLVCEATQLATGQLVAIKILQTDPDAAPTQRTELARFEREMKVMARITHPNIVRLMDSGRLPGGAVFLAMEYVRGVSLADRIFREGPLPVRESFRLMQQVLEALRAAHRQGVIHRDLKPHNIMVVDPGPRCHAMVLDFGISFITEEARGPDYLTLTRQNEVAGTPAYMAPEQLIDGLVTPSADIYAWGLVFVEALTGRAAIEETSFIRLVMRHTRGDPVHIPDPLERSPLGRLLRRATAVGRGDRYQSVDEALSELDSIDLRGAWVEPLEAELAAHAPALQDAPPTFDTTAPDAALADTAVAEDLPIRPLPKPPGATSSGARLLLPKAKSAGETTATEGPDPAPAPSEESESSDARRRPSSTSEAAPPPSRRHSREWRVLVASGVILVAACIIAVSVVLTRPAANPSDPLGPQGDRLEAPTSPSHDQRVPQEAAPTAEISFAEAAAREVRPEMDRMIAVPAGTFDMGCASTAEGICAPDERPAHRVDLAAFAIDATEVSVAAYARCVREGACEEPDAFAPGRRPACNWGHPDRIDHPVNCVTWYQADLYCEWTGERLPTEAEWERAARGSSDHRYPWGDSQPTCELAAMSTDSADCSEGTTVPVGSLPANASPVGALDMAGNVREWTTDWYDADYYSTSPSTEPTGPPSGEERVVRGGGWDDPAQDMRTTRRDSERPWETSDDIGFRCARSNAVGANP